MLKPFNVAEGSADDKTVLLREEGALKTIDDVKDGEREAQHCCIIKGHADGDRTDCGRPGVVKVNALQHGGAIGAHPSNKLVDVISEGLDLGS